MMGLDSLTLKDYSGTVRLLRRTVWIALAISVKTIVNVKNGPNRPPSEDAAGFKN